MYLVVMEVKGKKFGQLRVTLESLHFLIELIASYFLKIWNYSRRGCQLFSVYRLKPICFPTLPLLFSRPLASLATVNTAFPRHFVLYSLPLKTQPWSVCEIIWRGQVRWEWDRWWLQMKGKEEWRKTIWASVCSWYVNGWVSFEQGSC